MINLLIRFNNILQLIIIGLAAFLIFQFLSRNSLGILKENKASRFVLGLYGIIISYAVITLTTLEWGMSTDSIEIIAVILMVVEIAQSFAALIILYMFLDLENQ